MNRRDFLRRASLIAAGIVAADQLELLEKLSWKRTMFPSGQLDNTQDWMDDAIAAYDNLIQVNETWFAYGNTQTYEQEWVFPSGERRIVTTREATIPVTVVRPQLFGSHHWATPAALDIPNA